MHCLRNLQDTSADFTVTDGDFSTKYILFIYILDYNLDLYKAAIFVVCLFVSDHNSVTDLPRIFDLV